MTLKTKRITAFIMTALIVCLLLLNSNIAFATTVGVKPIVTEFSETATTITFKWNKINKAKSYQVALLNKSGSEVLKKTSIGNIQKHTFKNLDPARYYKVQLRAKLKSGSWSSWSKTYLHHTSYIKSKVTQVVDMYNNSLKDNQFKVKWNSVPGVSYYGIYYAKYNSAKYTCLCITKSNPFTGKGINNSNVKDFYYMRVLPLASNKAPTYDPDNYIFTDRINPKLCPGKPTLNPSSIYLYNKDCYIEVLYANYNYPNSLSIFRFYGKNKEYLGKKENNHGIYHTDFPKKYRDKIYYITVQAGVSYETMKFYSKPSSKTYVGNRFY